MSAAFAIEQEAAGRLRVSGRLGFAEAATALPRGAELAAMAGPVAVDLSRLEAPDSATLAVLLAWAAHASRRDARLRYTGMPANLRALAHLCEVEPLLGLA